MKYLNVRFICVLLARLTSLEQARCKPISVSELNRANPREQDMESGVLESGAGGQVAAKTEYYFGVAAQVGRARSFWVNLLRLAVNSVPIFQACFEANRPKFGNGKYCTPRFFSTQILLVSLSKHHRPELHIPLFSQQGQK
jgi:hypothetical protein